MTQGRGRKVPHPDDVETLRQFWDTALDRLVMFVQAKEFRGSPRRPTIRTTNETHDRNVELSQMTKTDLELFWISGSPYAWRALLALEVKQLKYTSQLLEASKGEDKTPEYLKLNPRGTVPTLKDGDLVVRESLAIMAFLDSRYPEPSLFGATAPQVARAWRLISEYLSYMHGPATRIISPLYFGKVAEKKSDLLAAVPQVHAELGRFQGELASSIWLAGEAIGAADIAIYPFIKSLLRAAAKDDARPLHLGLLPLEERFPRLAAWMQRVERFPGYGRTYPPHWRP